MMIQLMMTSFPPISLSAIIFSYSLLVPPPKSITPAFLQYIFDFCSDFSVVVWLTAVIQILQGQPMVRSLCIVIL